MSDRKSVTISHDSEKLVNAYIKRLGDETEFRDAVDKLIASGHKRLEALKKYADKKKDENGHVKKRETEGGNRPGWAKRKARREGAAEKAPKTKKVREPKAAKEKKPRAPRPKKEKPAKEAPAAVTAE